MKDTNKSMKDTNKSKKKNKTQTSFDPKQKRVDEIHR